VNGVSVALSSRRTVTWTKSVSPSTTLPVRSGSATEKPATGLCAGVPLSTSTGDAGAVTVGAWLAGASVIRKALPAPVPLSCCTPSLTTKWNLS